MKIVFGRGNTFLLFLLCRDTAHDVVTHESEGCFPGDMDSFAKIKLREDTPIPDLLTARLLPLKVLYMCVCACAQTHAQ